MTTPGTVSFPNNKEVFDKMAKTVEVEDATVPILKRILDTSEFLPPDLDVVSEG
jgi:hypothetical protein